MARRDRDRRGAEIVTSGWYAANIGDPHLPVEAAAARGRIAQALGRVRAARGLQIHRAARRGRGAAILRRERGALTALVLAALAGGPPIVILEMIPDRPPRSWWKRLAAGAWFLLVERPAVRHGMRAGQAMSAVESVTLAERYGISPERFPHVAWARCRTGRASAPGADKRAGVLSSGRAACDWETLFAAADGAPWPLTVVCGPADLERVETLNRGGRAEVLCEIAREEHDGLVRAAAVFAIVLADDGLSSGHVRLMTATELGAPVIVTAVETLAGYVVPGETAVTVPAVEPVQLRAAIDALLADPSRRDRLAAAALERGRSRTYADYFREVGEMVDRELGQAPV
jgi:hypothetical protein